MRTWINYIRYFLYLAINWNFRLAWFITRKEVSGEKKYLVNTVGIDDLSKSVPMEERVHASIYQPVNYFTAEELFEQVAPDDLKGTFLDVGCGKGRVLAMAAAYGFKEIMGFDFSAQLCHDAIQHCDQIEAAHPGTSIIIECEDARTYRIDESVSVIFLFNPFDDFVMKDFLKNVAKTLKAKPRQLKILYANPQSKKLWLNAGFEETFYFKKLKYLEGSVLVNRPA